MSSIKLSRISNKSKTSGPVITGITTFTGKQSARLPSGDNSERVGIESGSLRYNDTAGLLEFYDGETWNFIVPAEESANALGVFGGGFNNSTLNTNTISYVTISTTGDSEYFGDISIGRDGLAACSSSTRGIFSCGGINNTSGGTPNNIDYITFTTKGNFTDFGDVAETRNSLASCSSSTRGLFISGGNFSNTIEYITISTSGNTTDFGDAILGRRWLSACSSSTRGLYGAGYNPDLTPTIETNSIEYVTIASQGTTASAFGDLTSPRTEGNRGSCASSTRGIFGGGYLTPTRLDVIDYVTMASTGNALSFGDFSTARYGGLSACSSNTRGLFAGGYINDVNTTNLIDYITIVTTGNSINFGMLDIPRRYGAGCSNNHGGLL